MWKARNAEFEIYDGHTPIVEHLARVRGIADVHRYLNPPLSDQHSPTLIRNMQQAADTIMDAVNSDDRICIAGDSDADGVTSLAIMYNFLRRKGANVYFTYSQRSAGHGIHLHLPMIEPRTKLLLILDSSTNDVDTCARLVGSAGHAEDSSHTVGSIIVIDHHVVTDPNPHVLLVNPQNDDSPNKQLCTAALVYKLVQTACPEIASDYVDLAGVGLYADQMCMLEPENRSIVMHSLRNIRNPGLRRILEAKNRVPPYTCRDYAFTLSPTINSATRLDRIEIAIAALTCSEDEVSALVSALYALNARRKQLTADWMGSIDIVTTPTSATCVVVDNRIGAGFKGLIAMCVAQDQMLSSVLCVSESRENSAVLVGSFRSNIKLMSVLNTIPEVQTAVGHEQAGGCSFLKSDLDIVRKKLESRVVDITKCADNKHMVFDTRVETCLSTAQVMDIEAFSRVIGKNCDEPRFVFPDMYIHRETIVGAKQNTLQMKCMSSYDTSLINAVRFNMSQSDLAQYARGPNIDILGTIELNTWTNRYSDQTTTCQQIRMVTHRNCV